MKVFQQLKSQTIETLELGITHLLSNNKVKFIFGNATLTSNNSLSVVDANNQEQPYSFNHCILATGSEIIELPHFKFGGKILSSSDVLAIDYLPSSLVLLGGGYIGLELGMGLANLGVKVTIIEEQEDILMQTDEAVRKLIKQSMKKKGIQLLTSTKAMAWEEQHQQIQLQINNNGIESNITADILVVTVGRRPHSSSLGLEKTDIKLDKHGYIQVDMSLRTATPSILAIGDLIAGPALAHKASHEGKLAAEVISGKPYKVDYKALPLVIFSEPEIAMTGNTNQVWQMHQFPMRGNGRAILTDETDGFVKLYSDATNGILKGAIIVCPQASEMISEVSIAIEAGWTIHDLALTIHPHPTISESIMEAAELGIGFPIHI
jgi:dihydrolipoamide dehydrogenase